MTVQGSGRRGAAGSGRRIGASTAARPARRRPVRRRPTIPGRSQTAVYRGDTTGVSWWDGITFWIDVAYGSGPYDAAHWWESVAPDVQAITSRIGKTDEFSDYSSGQIQVTLNNSKVDPRDPAAFATPYDPNDQYVAGLRSARALLPGAPLRLRVDPGNGTKYPIGWGSIQGWPTTEDLTTKVQTVKLTALDALATLDRTILPESALAAAVLRDSPIAYYSCQQTADTPGFVEDLVGSMDLSVPTEATTGTATLPVTAGTTIIPPQSRSDPAMQATLRAGAPAPRSVDLWVTRTGLSPTPTYYRYTLDSTNYLQIEVDYGTVNSIRVYWSNSVLGRNSWTTNLDALPTVLDGETKTSHIAVTFRYPSTSYLYVDGQQVTSLATSAGTAATAATTNVIEVLGIDSPTTAPTTGFSHLAWYDVGFRFLPRTEGWQFYRAFGGGPIQEHYETGVHAWGYPICETTGQRLRRILDDIGWPEYYRTYSSVAIVNQVIDYAGQSVCTEPYDPAGAYSLGKMRDLATLEQGMLYVDFGNYLVWRNRNWRWKSADLGGPAYGRPNTPIFGIAPDYSLDQLRNLIVVSFAGGTRITKDADSIRNVGALDESVAIPDSDNAYLAGVLGAYRLRRNDAVFSSTGSPIRIRSISIDMRAITAAYRAILLAVVLGQWVYVTHEPARGNGLSVRASVQGIEHYVTRSGEWTVSLYLSAEDDDHYNRAPYLTMGHATYGKIGAADGNKVPY